MPRKYRVLLPRIYRILVLSVGDGSKDVKDIPIAESPGRVPIGETGVFLEGNTLMVVLSRSINWEVHIPKAVDRRESPWVEITARDIKEAMDELTRRGVKEVIKIRKFIPSSVHITSFNVIMAGSTPGYWEETEVNLEALTEDEGAYSIANIENRDRFSQILEELNLSNVRHLYSTRITSGYDATLYYFPISGESKTEGTFFLNVEVEDTNGTIMNYLSVENFMSTILSYLSTFLARYSFIKNLYRKSYPVYLKRVDTTKSKAMELRKSVSAILSSNNELKDRSLKDGYEENMLRNAAQYFASTTDILYSLTEEYSILKATYTTLLRSAGPLGKEVPVNERRRISATVMEYFTEETDKIIAAYETVIENLKNSEESMRNSLELLKTYLESEQRAASQKSKKAVDLLTIIFAAFGITDTISNFITYYLQDKTSPTFSMHDMVLGFVLTMLAPLIILAFAYVFYLRRTW